MIEIPVETVVSHAECTVTPGTAVPDGAERLRDPSVPALVVLENEQVRGIISQSDFVVLVAEESMPATVSELMSQPVITIEATATIRTAIDTMAQQGVKQLPVVKDGTYCGIVSSRMLAPYFSSHRLDVEWTDRPPALEVDDPNPVAGE